MTNPRVTIVVVPRERFSSTRESLESIYAHTDVPFKLVYVDGGSPAHVRRYLRAQAGRLGFQLIRTERYLSPNRARNLGLAAVDTDYVVFIDNDVVVADGWLGPLVRCAEETGAAVVGPLNCEYRPIHQFIHFAGGECHIVEQQKDGVVQRHMIDTIHRSGQRLDDVRDQLRRAQTEVAEFHCLMVRTEIFRTIGPFDEAMLSVRENLDFCMSVVEAGGSIYVEPASVITYLGGFTEHGTLPLAWSDIPYYVLRWNDTWVIESLRHFRDKWRLTEDDYFRRQYRNRNWRRRVFLIQGTLLRWVPSTRVRLLLETLLLPLDRLLSRLIVARYGRNRSGHGAGHQAGPQMSGRPRSASGLSQDGAHTVRVGTPARRSPDR